MRPSASSWIQSKAPQLILILITIIWGGSFITVQYGLNFSSPILFVALRFAAAAIRPAAAAAPLPGRLATVSGRNPWPSRGHRAAP